MEGVDIASAVGLYEAAERVKAIGRLQQAEKGEWGEERENVCLCVV